MNEEIYLSDLLAPVLAKWKLVLLCALIGATIGFLTTVRTPRAYESSATIFIQQSSPISSLRSSLPIAVSGSLGGNSVGYYITMLESDTLHTRVVQSLGLLRNPAFTNGKKLSLQQAVDKLKGCMVIRDSKDGGVDIVAKSSDPDLAARIANGLLDCLGETVSNSSTRKVRFIERKLADTTQMLNDAQDKLLAFQKRSGVPVIEEEGKHLLEELSKLDAQLLYLDVELLETKSRLSNGGDLDSLVAQEISKRGLEASREHVVKVKDETLERLNDLPDVASTYLRLERDVNVLSKTFELLTERYQVAKIEQQGEGGDYQVIDRARPAEMPLARGTVAKTAVDGFAGFLISATAIAVAGLGRKRRKGLRQSARNLEG